MFQILAHSPISFPRVRDHGVVIPTNSEVFVEIDPKVTTADIDTLKRIDVVQEKFSKIFNTFLLLNSNSFLWYFIKLEEKGLLLP